MIIHHLPHQNNVQQIGYKLLSTLNFKGKGRGGENPHLSVFMERFSREQVEGVRRVPTDREELRGGARGGSGGKAFGTSEEVLCGSLQNYTKIYK